eukprot:scaffold30404_cov15-Tisochrysis_lutea.AAC.1
MPQPFPLQVLTMYGAVKLSLKPNPPSAPTLLPTLPSTLGAGACGLGAVVLPHSPRDPMDRQFAGFADSSCGAAA